MRISDWSSDVCSSDLLTRWKGHAVLLRALALLAKQRGAADFIAVLSGDHQGRDGYVDELKLLTNQLGLNAAVRLPGDCKDMPAAFMLADVVVRSEEHTSELQSLMRISYAVFCF